MLRTIKIQDKKAPRFRWTKGRYHTMNEELYQSYVKTVENPIMDFSLFRDVIEDFSDALKQAAIDNRDGVKLPAMMGILAVASCKITKRLPVNWKDSLEAKLYLKEHNFHTGGLACKIVYSVYTAKYKFRNWALWRFEGNRDFKTKVSQAFEKNYRYYKRMDNKSHVSKMFRDEYITKISRNDSVRTDLEHSRDEQINQQRLTDNG